VERIVRSFPLLNSIGPLQPKYPENIPVNCSIGFMEAFIIWRLFDLQTSRFPFFRLATSTLYNVEPLDENQGSEGRLFVPARRAGQPPARQTDDMSRRYYFPKTNNQLGCFSRSMADGDQVSLIRFGFVPRNNLASLILNNERTTRCFRSSFVPQEQLDAQYFVPRGALRSIPKGLPLGSVL
jgi:hypothetical protein